MGQLGLAFVAGLASFLSPCVMPLIPVYLAFLTGTSFSELESGKGRRLTVLHSLCFIVGFSAVFILMGASASAVGGQLFAYRDWIERIGGAALVLMGMWMVGLLKIGFLYKEARFHYQEKPAGFFGSVLVGSAFAAGWTPCVGPVLAGILLLASRSGSVWEGMVLLSVYSLGFAIPLFICALAIERMIPVLNKIKPKLPLIEKATGVCLMFVGVALASGWFGWLSTWTLSYFPNWTQYFARLGL
ncbi:MAG: cytochrome C biogenesis protein [Elusimicrobia bacterium]|nr:MAG: cytochrome C biogenesis protein [Elusimicrobiota bacterium]